MKKIILIFISLLAFSAAQSALATVYSVVVPIQGIVKPPPPGGSASTAGVMSNWANAVNMVVSDPVTNLTYDSRLGTNTAGSYQPMNGSWVSGFPIYEQSGTNSSVIVTYSQPTQINQIVITGTRGALQPGSTSPVYYSYSTSAKIEVDYGNGTFVTLSSSFALPQIGFATLNVGAVVSRVRMTSNSYFMYYQMN